MLNILFEYIDYKYINNYPPTYGIYSFLIQANLKGSILDVGCGNNSPPVIGAILPDCAYIGVDINSSNSSISPNQTYIYCDQSALFAKCITEISSTFDTVISNHNLEHCDNVNDTIIAMSKKLNINGKLFIATPSTNSINFPTRAGCLNYYDDYTHKNAPIDSFSICSLLTECGLTILVHKYHYKPFLQYIVGFLQEPFSKADKKIYSCSWSYYGFETIIWAQKI